MRIFTESKGLEGGIIWTKVHSWIPTRDVVVSFTASQPQGAPETAVL